MRRNLPSEKRLNTIRKRQDPPQWGPGYVPGQLATREEAPEYSRPSRIRSFWLSRDVHVMSDPERDAYLLASWLGCFFDLHESRMLPPEPHQGFLVGCTKASSQSYQAQHGGTIDAAHRLGLLAFHPVIKVSIGNEKIKSTVAYPMLADQLYFAEDEYGVYAINWCIKNKPEDFIKPFSGSSPWDRKMKSQEEHQARLAIESEVFNQAGIRTISLSRDDIGKNLRANLSLLYQYIQRPSSLSTSLIDDFVDEIGGLISQRVPPIETILKMQRRYGGAIEDYKIAFYSAIWFRRVDVDVNRAINIDSPLRPSDGDVLNTYHQWVSRCLP